MTVVARKGSFTMIFDGLLADFITLKGVRIITYSQIHSIMQNKAKVKSAKINLKTYVAMRYEKMDIWLFGKNKAKTNPIKAKTKPIQTQLLQRAKLMQSVYLQRIMKKNADRGHEKTNPKQTQFQNPKYEPKKLKKKRASGNFFVSLVCRKD